MLAKANRHGEVYGAVPGLARLANVSLEECETALQTFQSPDRWSRTPDNEGRRIEPITGGWRLLNFVKFDRLKSAIESAEREAERKREWDKTNRAARPNARYRGRVTPDVPPTKPDVPPTISDAPPTATTARAKAEDQKQKSCDERSDERTSLQAGGESPAAVHLTLNTGVEYPITEAQVRDFAALYPAVDVPQQLRNMRGWCIGNPTKRKTRAGILRFVNKWLAKAQDESKESPNANRFAGRKLSAVELVEQAIADRKRDEGFVLDGQAVRLVAR